jgi:3-hydroxyacyl-CoA dehydrogenase
MTRNSKKVITIVGGGNIGSSWALLFLLHGYRVNIYDKDCEVHYKSKKSIKIGLNLFIESDNLDSKKKKTILNNINFFKDLKEALHDTKYVIESINENLKDKINVFKDISQNVGKDIVIASSSSFIPISKISEKTINKSRCLNLHPGNPPYLLKFAEIVPSTYTSKKAVEQTKSLLYSVKLHPIILKKEIDGFVFNRLQGALLKEAYSLINDDIVSASDIDSLVTNGLGLRWAVLGPFETIDLNTKGGIENHSKIMIPFYKSIFSKSKNYNFETKSIKKVIIERRKLLPLENLSERISWRDKTISKLINLLK